MCSGLPNLHGAGTVHGSPSITEKYPSAPFGFGQATYYFPLDDFLDLFLTFEAGLTLDYLLWARAFFVIALYFLFGRQRGNPSANIPSVMLRPVGGDKEGCSK